MYAVSIGDLIAHSFRLGAGGCETEPFRVSKKIERKVTMALRNCFEQRLAAEFLVFPDQNVGAHGAKTSFVRIEFDAEPLFAGSIIQTKSDIRMSIVTGGRY